MKGYIQIRPMYQSDEYKTIPFDLVQKLKVELSEYDYVINPLFCSIDHIYVYKLEDDRIIFKSEHKLNK